MRKPDTPRLVSELCANENLTGKTCGSSEKDQSKVMGRYLLRLKPLRFLLSKEDALACYNRVIEGTYDQRNS